MAQAKATVVNRAPTGGSERRAVSVSGRSEPVNSPYQARLRAEREVRRRQAEVMAQRERERRTQTGGATGRFETATEAIPPRRTPSAVSVSGRTAPVDSSAQTKQRAEWEARRQRAENAPDQVALRAKWEARRQQAVEGEEARLRAKREAEYREVVPRSTNYGRDISLKPERRTTAAVATTRPAPSVSPSVNTPPTPQFRSTAVAARQEAEPKPASRSTAVAPSQTSTPPRKKVIARPKPKAPADGGPKFPDRLPYSDSIDIPATETRLDAPPLPYDPSIDLRQSDQRILPGGRSVGLDAAPEPESENRFKSTAKAVGRAPVRALGSVMRAFRRGPKQLNVGAGLPADLEPKAPLPDMKRGGVRYREDDLVYRPGQHQYEEDDLVYRPGRK